MEVDKCRPKKWVAELEPLGYIRKCFTEEDETPDEQDEVVFFKTV